MSSEHIDESVSVSERGISLTKRLDREDFSVPVVSYEFDSELPVRTAIRVDETIPDDISPDELGFRPDYGEDNWSITGDSLTFERELGPTESYRTLFGYWSDGEQAVVQFLDEPDNFEVVTVEAEEASSVPAGETSPDGDTESASDPLAIGRQTGQEKPDASSASATSLSTAPESPPTGNAPGGDEQSSGELHEAAVVEALIAAIEHDELTADQRRTLRQFVGAEEMPGPLAARVENLERTVARVDAYTGALEEFLSEHESGRGAIQDLQTELDSLNDTVSDLESTVEGSTGRLATVEAQLEQIDATVSDQREAIDDVEDELAAVRDHVSADVEKHLDVLEEDLAQIDQHWNRLQSLFSADGNEGTPTADRRNSQ